jgi:hypothetical protein
VEPATLGDPMRPLIWVSKSVDKLAATLTEMGHPISADTVRKELVKLGFSRQPNRKADEGSKHPDRNAQFEHINAKVVAAQVQGQPVISVDTKKKELVGNYKNGGTDYRPKGDPRRVKVHDFEKRELPSSGLMSASTGCGLWAAACQKEISRPLSAHSGTGVVLPSKSLQWAARVPLVGDPSFIR